MFGMPDMFNVMKKRRRGSMSKGIMWFALGAALGAGVSRMRNQNHGQHWVEEAEGPMEVDI